MPKLEITPTIAIDESELVETFARASGPGGQNVNKVESAVQLRFDARRSPGLPDSVAVRLLKAAGAKATNDGVIVITASRFRDQAKNRADARARLVALIAEAAVPPKPRIATKPTRASKERRLDAKKTRSAVKKMRKAAFD